MITINGMIIRDIKNQRQIIIVIKQLNSLLVKIITKLENTLLLSIFSCISTKI